MARKTERVVIGGTQYQITQLGAVEGRGLYKKFVTAIGPLLREVISGPLIGDLQKQVASGGEAGDDDQLRMMQMIGPLLVRAIEIIPSDLFEEMCSTFAPTCKVAAGKDSSGKPMLLDLSTLFDTQFAGDYASMTAWLGHCVKVNGFLGMLGGGNAAQATAEQPTQ